MNSQVQNIVVRQVFLLLLEPGVYAVGSWYLLAENANCYNLAFFLCRGIHRDLHDDVATAGWMVYNHVHSGNVVLLHLPDLPVRQHTLGFSGFLICKCSIMPL